MGKNPGKDRSVSPDSHDVMALLRSCTLLLAIGVVCLGLFRQTEKELSQEFETYRPVAPLPTVIPIEIPPPETAPQTFPALEALAPNIEFWTKIYTQYSLTQGVIHDRFDLSIVYDVIDLHHPDSHRGRKKNRVLMQKAKQKYKEILLGLAQEPDDPSPEARRVADLFGPAPPAELLRRASRQIHYQPGEKERFREGIIRSGAYLEKIKAVLAQYHLPEDLVYLPHVESSFENTAYNRSGAAGIWQITRPTGRKLLTIDRAVDERWDPLMATHAAARLLRDNRRMLGSWPLAITAYNHGTAGMKRARRRVESDEAFFRTYTSRRYGFASRNFYAMFLAAREAAKNHERYYQTLVLDRPSDQRTLIMAGYADVKDVAHHFKVAPKTIRQLNPALQEAVFTGWQWIPKGYRLRLPPAPESPPAGVLAAFPKERYYEKQRQATAYRVRPGDTAGSIAKKFGIKLSDLKAANGLNAKARIYKDQLLHIPLGADPASLRRQKIASVESGQTVGVD